MNLKSIQIAAVVTFFLFLLGVQSDITRIVVEAERPKPQFELDSGVRWSRHQAKPGALVLRLALVSMATSGNQEAILDAAQISLTDGEEFAGYLGFESPETVTSGPTRRSPLESLRSSLGRRRNSSKSRREFGSQQAPNGRPLPPEFGRFQFSLELSGRYHGSSDRMHLLGFDRMEGRSARWYRGGSSRGGIGLSQHSLALEEDEPVVRVLLRDDLALFAIVTRRASSYVRQPGERASWRWAFRHLSLETPALDRERVAAAVAQLEPEGPLGLLEAGDFIGYGTLMDQLAAAYVLRDTEVLGIAQERLRLDPALLDQVTSTEGWMVKDVYSKNFVSWVAEPWLKFARGWMRGEFIGLPAEGYRTWIAGFRIMEISSDSQLARKIIDPLISRTRLNYLDQIVMAREKLGSTPEVQAQYQRLRDVVISQLPSPWSLVARSGWWLLGYLLLIPLLLLLVVLVRPDPTLLHIEVSRGLIVLLAVGTLVSIGGTPWKFVVIPVWCWLAVRWLREPVEHGLMERALIWVALVLFTIEALVGIHWYPSWPSLKSIQGSGPILCWILLARCLLQDGRWKQPGLFSAFIWSQIGLAVVVTLGARSIDKDVGAIWLVLTVFCLIAFVISGPELTERGHHQRSAHGRQAVLRSSRRRRRTTSPG